MYLFIFRQLIRSFFLLCSLFFLTGLSLADEKFPNKPIKIVVGSEAGSAPDAIARVLSIELAKILDQSVVIENRPGAAGTLGASGVSTSSADGYTLLMGTISNISLAPSFYTLKYDPVKSFTPIGMVASVPLVLVTSPAFQANDYKQFIGRIKPLTQVSYSSPGVGGPQHLAGVLLQREGQFSAVHVPYKSGGAAVTAVVAGDVQFAFVGIPVAASMVAAKKLVPLFITSPSRLSTFPETPTGTEVGLKGFDIDNWHALLAPPGLTSSVQSTLENALQTALKSPTVKEQFQKLGAEPAQGSSKQLKSHIASETERWSKFVADNKIKAD
jgi:tripartite-type tricarboxylate transporter receptor subunit TctC